MIRHTPMITRHINACRRRSPSPYPTSIRSARGIIRTRYSPNIFGFSSVPTTRLPMASNISLSTQASAIREEPVTYWNIPYSAVREAESTPATEQRISHCRSRSSHTTSKYPIRKQTNSSAGFRDPELSETVPPQNRTTANAITITSRGSTWMLRFPRSSFRTKQKKT